MNLHIEFPDDLTSADLLRQKNIPCLCKVSKEFEVVVEGPLPKASGIVSGWDRSLLEERAVAGGGGQYTHYCFGMITLQKIEPSVYKIVDLSFFQEPFGWCPILINGEYGPPGDFWDDEEEFFRQ